MSDPRMGTFWSDLAEDARDPEFLAEYEAQTSRIETIDAIVNQLDAAREERGWSKADLARAIYMQPSTVRRLFSAVNRNPTLGTVAEVATALGLRVRLEPIAVEASTGDSDIPPAPDRPASISDLRGVS